MKEILLMKQTLKLTPKERPISPVKCIGIRHTVSYSYAYMYAQKYESEWSKEHEASSTTYSET